MKANESRLHAFYLRSAGLVSAVLGLISAVSFFLSFVQDVSSAKWSMFFFGVFGIVVSYILGRDVLDRFKHRELIDGGVPTRQARFAVIGMRFTSVLWLFVGSLLLAFFFFWLIIALDVHGFRDLMCPVFHCDWWFFYRFGF